MNGRFWIRLALTLVFVAALIGVGAYIYNAGVAQGLAESARVAGGESGTLPMYGPYARPFFGFGFFGWLIPLFFLFLFFGALRAIFWRRPWGGSRMRGPWGNGAPPMFEEWHRRLHETPSGETAPSSGQSTGKV